MGDGGSDFGRPLDNVLDYKVGGEDNSAPYQVAQAYLSYSKGDWPEPLTVRWTCSVRGDGLIAQASGDIRGSDVKALTEQARSDALEALNRCLRRHAAASGVA